MMDWKLFDTLTLLEKMCDKPAMYFTDAAKSGKLHSINISFDITKDEHGVPTKVQHILDVEYNG